MIKEYILRFKRRAMVRRGPREEIECVVMTVLMERQQIDGKERQRPVKYLAQIHERDMGDQVQQAIFWARIGAMLDEMAIDVDERKKIERQIRALIPRPSTYDS